MGRDSRTVEVSVIIPAYGRPQYLRDLLRSILAQGSTTLEVLVVDDGSPECIEAVLGSEFAGTAITFMRQENAGVAAARNVGASMARGEYLLFVDDDDLVPQGSIDWRVQFLRSSPAHSAVSGRCEFIRDEVAFQTEPVRWRGDLTHWDLLIHNRFFSPGQVLVRRSSFEQTSGCRRDCIGSDDWALWIDLARIAPLYCDERIGLGYRVHGGNFSRNIATMCVGAERVADNALASLCRRHAAVADSLVTGFVSSVYDGKLKSASRAALQSSDWSGLADATTTRLRLFGRVIATRAGRKLALLRYHHRWRMSSAELERLGRDCPDCAGVRRPTRSAARRVEEAQVLA